MKTQRDNHHDHGPASLSNGDRRLGQRARMVAVAFVGLALAALLFEHRVHLLGLLPYLVLLLCPLMHLFMHGGHHHGQGGSGHKHETRDPKQGGES